MENLMPKTLNEALAFLAKHEALIINGGTDVMVQKRTLSEMPLAFSKPTLYLKSLKALNYIKRDNQTVHIGATTPYESMLYDENIPALFKTCLKLFASPGIRNMGTLAGNIGNASPAADGVLMLYLYDATITLKAHQKQRSLPIENLITGVKQTSKNAGELITNIAFELPSFTHTFFKKVGGRKSDAISKVSFAGAANVIDGKIKDIRLAFGAINTTVIRDKSFEASLKGQTPQRLIAQLKDIKAHYAPLIKPIDDQRSNAKYRHKVALNLCEAFIRTLEEKNDG